MRRTDDASRLGTPAALLDPDDDPSPSEGRISMLDKLDFMVRFWRLRARHEALDKPLTAFERVELLSLLQLMATDQHLPDPGPAPRTEHSFPIQITASGGFLGGELRLVCPDGIVIAASAPLPAGQSTLVRLVDAIAGVEYALPCVVVWSYVGSPSAAALRIDGVPTRTTFAMPELSVWRSSPSVAPQES
jgi:hypothetical protein